MSRRVPPVSFRARILLIALAGIVPLAVAGLWLSGSAARSGEALLRERLAESLDQAAAEVGAHWVRLRSQLLDLSEAAERASLPSGLPHAVEHVTVVDRGGTALWSAARPDADRAGQAGPLLAVTLGRYTREGHEIGQLASDIRLFELMPQRGGLSLQGITVAVYDPRGDAWLVPLPWDAAALTGARVRWGGEEWVVERRRIADPPLELVAAAPLTPFVQPFHAAARRGAWVVLAVLVLGLVLASGLAAQLTRSLERVAGAADEVGRGALDTRVEESGPDEIGRVARAFNTMTAGLRSALAELSRRESLAAVGEFAASLAHEVRNPLTAIKVDLQLVEEALPVDSPLRALQRGALDEIDRLDRTVAGTLRIARSGMLAAAPVDVAAVVKSALHTAEPALRQQQAECHVDVDDPVSVSGDADALRQLFLNLLLNAAQAVDAGGAVYVATSVEDGQAVVRVRDTGAGMPPEVRARAFEPFYSTRAGGSGLGLAIAERTVAAHRGSIDIESHAGKGTQVTVRLPLAAG